MYKVMINLWDPVSGDYFDVEYSGIIHKNEYEAIKEMHLAEDTIDIINNMKATYCYIKEV